MTICNKKNLSIFINLLLETNHYLEVKDFIKESDKIGVFSLLPKDLIDETLREEIAYSRLLRDKQNGKDYEEKKRIAEKLSEHIPPIHYFGKNSEGITMAKLLERFEKEGLVYPLCRISPTRFVEGKSYYDTFVQGSINSKKTHFEFDCHFVRDYQEKGQLSFPCMETFVPWSSFVEKVIYEWGTHKQLIRYPIYADYQIYSVYLALTSSESPSQLKKRIEKFENMAYVACYVSRVASAFNYDFVLKYFKNWTDEEATTGSADEWNYYWQNFYSEQVEEMQKWSNLPLKYKQPISKYFTEGVTNIEMGEIMQAVWKLNPPPCDGEKSFRSHAKQYEQESYHDDFRKECKKKAEILLEFYNSEEIQSFPQQMFEEVINLLKNKNCLTTVEVALYNKLLQLFNPLLWLTHILFGEELKHKYKSIQLAYKPNAACFNCGKVFIDTHHYSLTKHCKELCCVKDRALKRKSKQRKREKFDKARRENKIVDRMPGEPFISEGKKMNYCQKCGNGFEVKSPTRPETYCKECRSNTKELYRFKMQRARSR